MKISQLFKRKPNPSQQPRRCCHRHKDGTQCSAHPQRGSQYCFFHNPDPAQQEQRRQASSAGGRASTRPPLLPPDLPVLSLKTASDVASLLEETTNQVRRGEIELCAATTICYLSNSLVHALEVASRAERQAAQEHQTTRKKHPAPLKLIVYDHAGRIIDQIPPDGPPAPFPGTENGETPTASSNTPSPTAEQGMSAPQINADQRGLVQDPSAPSCLRTENRELGTASSNTPSPTAEQGMSAPQINADQRGLPSLRTENRELRTVSENALQQPGRSPDLRGSSTRASALAQNDTQKNLTTNEAKPLLRAENRELRTTPPPASPPPKQAQPIQYPPGMGPRHLGPGPGGSLMAGTPLMPWWRRERLNKAHNGA